MKIAIIGSGISGLVAAYLLSKKHEVVLFEKEGYIGGHTATKTVQVGQSHYDIDTGFIVFNDRTYPNFIKLLDKLGVESQPTTMGFSVFEKNSGFEYSGTNINTLFSDRRTLLSKQHWVMLREILRFNDLAITDWKNGELDNDLSLGEYLLKHGFSETFANRYLVPMGSAIWSTSCNDMRSVPARFFIRFFYNHGLLEIKNRPTWRVIKGGSKQYLHPLYKSFESSIQSNEAVLRVVRSDDKVEIQSRSGSSAFDQVVFACHSDQALKLLDNPTNQEKEILSALRYRDNSVVLHTDERWLPKHQRTWTSWNYCLSEDKSQLPILTYNMNILQGIKSDSTFCVTLNANGLIDRTKILGEYCYAHPIFDGPAIDAQRRWSDINGVNKTWFAGAYWFNGFHEDGVNSALRVSEALGGDIL